MAVLDLNAPTLTRNFTYYDRAAIKLEPQEMTSVRLRLSVSILRSPLSRSLNFKYPLAKEFYGYIQMFSSNNIINESPINYPRAIVWDYWNEHATIAQQLTGTLQRLSRFLVRTIDFEVFLLLEGSPLAESLTLIRPEMEQLAQAFVLEASGSPIRDSFAFNDFVNTFQHPWDLVRLRFTFGTVFTVKLESWVLGNTLEGSAPGLPSPNPPYEQPKADDAPPSKSPGSADPNAPYGINPPGQSPIDPDLDPDDFSNPPQPPTGGNTVNLQGWQIPGIPGVQSAGFAVGCPAANLGASIPGLAGAQQVVNLGVKPLATDDQGRVSAAAVLAAFPGFQFGSNTFAADNSCGVNGVV